MLGGQAPFAAVHASCISPDHPSVHHPHRWYGEGSDTRASRTQSHADLGRVVNALQTTKEFSQAGDDVELRFDGAGTEWIDELEDPTHDLHHRYHEVTDEASACDHCVSAFGQDAAVEESDVERVESFDGHPSDRRLVEQGYEVITY